MGIIIKTLKYKSNELTKERTKHKNN